MSFDGTQIGSDGRRYPVEDLPSLGHSDVVPELIRVYGTPSNGKVVTYTSGKPHWSTPSGSGGGSAKVGVFTVLQAGSDTEDSLLFTDGNVYDSSGNASNDTTTFVLDSGTVILNAKGIYQIALRVFLDPAAEEGTALGLGLGTMASRVLISSAPADAVIHLAAEDTLVKTSAGDLGLSPTVVRYNNGTWAGTNFDAQYTITKLG